MADAFRLSFLSRSDGISATDLELTRFEGEREFSRPYEYRLVLRSDVEGGISPDVIQQMLGVPAHIEFGRVGAITEVHGIVTRVELRSMLELDRSEYEIILRPTLWRAGLSHTSRIFQDVTVADIAEAVLEQHRVRFESRLSATYPEREYVVQSDESDLDFLHRQLEHWGIFYFFEQSQDGELLVLADSNREMPSVDPRSYAPHDAAHIAEEDTIASLRRRHQLRPLDVALADYNWRTPSVAPKGSAPAEARVGYGTQRYYAEHIKDSSEGDALAKVRGEALAVSHETYYGETFAPGLLPGSRFEVTGYPVGDLDQEYAVTAIAESASGDGSDYHQRFDAIPYAVSFRPQRVTPKPKINGFMHAVVDGEVPGMAAPIDEQGRYKVVMPFDEYGEPGKGKSSRWVRMAQTSAGAGYGTHFPAHIGIEVVISHLGGDPDRPVIVGTIPNPETSSPVTADDATKSRIKTKSGILIEFEDAG